MSSYILNIIGSDDDLQLSVPIKTPSNVAEWLYTIKQDMEVDVHLSVTKNNVKGISFSELISFFVSWSDSYVKHSETNKKFEIQIVNSDTNQVRMIAESMCVSFDKSEKLVSLYLTSCKLGANANVVYLDGSEYLSVPTLLEEASEATAVIIIMQERSGRITHSVSEGWKKETLTYAFRKTNRHIEDTLFDNDLYDF